MSTMPSVVVKKGGFLSAAATGFFGFLTASVVCASGLGFYALYIVDNKAGKILNYGERVVEHLPEWQKALPPMLADAVRDRRDPSYRDEIELTARVEPGRDNGRPVVVIEAKNKGRQTVSVLSARVILEDDRGVPTDEFRTYVATPLTLEDEEWQGPLMPGSTRRFVRHIDRAASDSKATVEVTELRVWVEQAAPALPAAEPAADS